jgi:hypothetical protein
VTLLFCFCLHAWSAVTLYYLCGTRRKLWQALALLQCVCSVRVSTLCNTVYHLRARTLAEVDAINPPGGLGYACQVSPAASGHKAPNAMKPLWKCAV